VYNSSAVQNALSAVLTLLNMLHVCSVACLIVSYVCVCANIYMCYDVDRSVALIARAAIVCFGLKVES